MTVRLLTSADWPEAEALYWELTKSGAVADKARFAEVLAHPGTQVAGKWVDGHLVSMATLHILPNMTYAGRPYGLVENVVTALDSQRQGYGRDVLAYVTTFAQEADCYKIMLLTGRARAARGSYEAAGFSADDKWGMTIRF